MWETVGQILDFDGKIGVVHGRSTRMQRRLVCLFDDLMVYAQRMNQAEVMKKKKRVEIKPNV